MSHTCDKLFNSVTPNKSKSKQLANAVWGLFVAIYRCSQAVTALQSTIRGEPLNDSLEMTSITQHTWQRWIWQPILLHEASSPSPNSCLHVCSLHFSCKLHVAGSMESEALAWLCNRASAVQGCSVGKCSGLQEARRAVWLLAGRDTTAKICWLHTLLLLPAYNWKWAQPHMRKLQSFSALLPDYSL